MNWVPALRKVVFLFQRYGLSDYFRFVNEGQRVLATRIDLEVGEPMGEYQWNEFSKIISRSDILYNERTATCQILKSNVPDLLLEFDLSYSPWQDEWVLRHLLYRHKSRRVVSNILGCSMGKVEYWTDKLGVDLPWRNLEVMTLLYDHFDNSIRDVSRYLNCGEDTVSRWLDHHDLQDRQRDDTIPREILEDLLIEQRISKSEVGKRLGCSAGKVIYWADKYGIKPPVNRPSGIRYISHNGYPCWQVELDGNTRYIRIHRLAAVAKCGFSEVRDKSVHHLSEVPWDNRLSNLVLVSNQQHAKLHYHD